MTARANVSALAWWTLGVVAVAGLALGGYHFAPETTSAAGEISQSTEQDDEGVHVEVIHPAQGGLERTTTQPGSVQAYERARIYAAVSGYLKMQAVDIGDRVTKGQLLAKIDVPELEKQVKQYKAGLQQARAKVRQMEARVATARADLLAKKAKIKQADANIKSASAWLRFRKKQYERMASLLKLDSIDGRLVDEHQERYEAAVEAENAAKAARDTAVADEAAADANILQAQADVLEANAEVMVDEARIERGELMVAFSEIRSPCDGVITQRSMLPNEYVRAANESGTAAPLLSVERTDLFRVVVQVPDRDVPFTDPGDPAVIEIDALSGKKFPAKVSRLARSEDPDTRLMRVEIDLPNPKGEICRGMYGRVTIILDRPEGQVSLPSSCLVRKVEGEGPSVFVVRDNHAHRVRVKITADNGVWCAVSEGLSAKDDVVLKPVTGLTDGAEVVVAAPIAKH